ncbi:MAG: hypothetical protein R3232_09865 [Clostridia bacterium]|nr:hypothetical protein [Clostridia bacterium]
MRIGCIIFSVIALFGCESYNNPSIDDPDHRLAILLASIDIPSNCIMDNGQCNIEKSLLGTEIFINNFTDRSTYQTEGKYYSETLWERNFSYGFRFTSARDGMSYTGTIEWNAENYLDQNDGYTILTQGCYDRNYSRTDASNSTVQITLKKQGESQKKFSGSIHNDSIYPYNQESVCQTFPMSQFPESIIRYPNDCFLSVKNCMEIASKNQMKYFGQYYWNRSPAFFFNNLPPLFKEYLFPNNLKEAYPRLEFHTGKRTIVFVAEHTSHNTIEVNYEASIAPDSGIDFSQETARDLFDRKVSYKTSKIEQTINLIGENQILMTVFNSNVEPFSSHRRDYPTIDSEITKSLTFSQAMNEELTGSTLLDHPIETILAHLPRLDFISPGFYHFSGTTNEIDTIVLCDDIPCPSNDYIAVQIDPSGLESNFVDWDSLLTTTHSYEEMIQEHYVYDSDPEFLHYTGVTEFMDIQGNELSIEINTMNNTARYELINNNGESIETGTLYISIGAQGVLCESQIYLPDEYRYDSPGPRYVCKKYYQFSKTVF